MAKKKAKAKTKEVATRQPNGLQTYTGKTSWGAGTKVEAEEILIPKLLLLQSNADLVTRKKSKLKGGDIVHSVNEDLLSSQPDSKSPIELIIFDSFKTRNTYVQEGDAMKYSKSEPWLPEFRDRVKYPYEGRQVNGALTKWREAKHYVGLTPQSIKDGKIFPFVVTMKGLSMKISNKLSTIFAQLQDFNAPSAAIVVELTVDQEDTDNGKFWVWRVTKGRHSTEKEVGACKKWFDIMQQRNVVIDDSKETETDTGTQSSAKDSDTASKPRRGRTKVSQDDVAI